MPAASPKLRGGSGWRSWRQQFAHFAQIARVGALLAAHGHAHRHALHGAEQIDQHRHGADGVPSALTGFSNITAGPPSAISRVWISVISSTVETGSFTRTSSPALSSRAMKSRKER